MSAEGQSTNFKQSPVKTENATGGVQKSVFRELDFGLAQVNFTLPGGKEENRNGNLEIG